MKRAVLFLAMTETIVSALLYLFGRTAVAAAGLIMLAASAVCFIVKRFGREMLAAGVLLLFGTVFCVYLLYYDLAVVKSAESLDGRAGTVTCTVIEEPDNSGDYTCLSVKTSGDKAENSNLCRSVKLVLFVPSRYGAYSADIGDVITADVEFEKADETYRRSNFADGIHISAFVKSAEITGHKNTLYSYCVGIRRGVRKRIDENFFGDSAAVLKGLMLGDTDDMSDGLRSDFAACGVSHITAVSGMHISLLCMMFFTAANLFINRRKAAALSFVPLLGVVLITGMTPSVVRSGIMCAVTFAGIILFRKADALNSLGTAVAVMLAVNPFYVCSLSFQLSCSATAGVIIVSKYYDRFAGSLDRIKPRLVKRIASGAVLIILQSVGAVLFTLPFQILEFGFVSVIAPLSSLAVCAAAVYALSAAVIGIIISFIPAVGAVSAVFFAPTRLLLGYMVAVIRLLADIPFSYIAFGSRAAVIWLGMSLLLIGIWILLDKAGGVRIIAVLISVMLVLSLWSDRMAGRSMARVTVLDAGKGFCTVVSYKNKCVAIGCGDDRSDCFKLKEFLKLYGITEVSALLLPSDREVCAGGFRSFYDDIPFQTVIAPEDCGAALGLGGLCDTIGDKDTVYIGDISVTARSGGYGLVYEISCAGRTFAVDCAGYGEADMSDGVDFAVFGGALPENGGIPLIIASGRRYLTEEERTLIGDGRAVCANDRTITVKFKQGKGLTVYAE